MKTVSRTPEEQRAERIRRHAGFSSIPVFDGEFELEFREISITRNVRSDLVVELEGWVGKTTKTAKGPNSKPWLPWLTLDDDGVIQHDICGTRFDVYVLQDFGRCNVFVSPPTWRCEPDEFEALLDPAELDLHIDEWTDTNPLTPGEEAYYTAIARIVVERDTEYWHRECRWAMQRPWEQLPGKTPTEAIAYLTDAGFGVRAPVVPSSASRT